MKPEVIQKELEHLKQKIRTLFSRSKTCWRKARIVTNRIWDKRSSWKTGCREQIEFTLVQHRRGTWEQERQLRPMKLRRRITESFALQKEQVIIGTGCTTIDTSKHESSFSIIFYFCGSFLPSWIRIRNANPDQLNWLSPDPKHCSNLMWELEGNGGIEKDLLHHCFKVPGRVRAPETEHRR